MHPSLPAPGPVASPLLWAAALGTVLAGCSAVSTDDETAGAAVGGQTDATLDAGALDAGHDAAAEPAAATYYTDVKPILDAHCASCHHVGGVGPMPLTTWEEAAPYAGLVAESVATRAMPPWDAMPVRAYRFDPTLSDEQIATIEAWAAAGAPEGDPGLEGAALFIEQSTLSRADVTLGLAEPYLPQDGPDEYRCFILDWEIANTIYVTGFEANPTSLQIAHHALLWQVPSTFAHIVTGADGADGRPGYSCFGSAAPTGGDADFPAGILGAWAPGTGGYDYPDGTGQPVSPGDLVVLQMHYSLAASTDPVPDQTTVSLSLSDEVETAGGSAAFFNFEWFFVRDTMLIPAGEHAVVHDFTAPLVGHPSVAALSPWLTGETSLRIWGIIPHQHLIGAAIQLEVRHSDGSTEPIVQVDDWDFAWQRMYWLAEPIDVTADDQIHIECVFDNSAANQPVKNGEIQEPSDVHFGDGSFDEMCLGLLYISRVPAE